MISEANRTVEVRNGKKCTILIFKKMKIQIFLRSDAYILNPFYPRGAFCCAANSSQIITNRKRNIESACTPETGIGQNFLGHVQSPDFILTFWYHNIVPITVRTTWSTL